MAKMKMRRTIIREWMSLARETTIRRAGTGLRESSGPTTQPATLLTSAA